MRFVDCSTADEIFFSSRVSNSSLNWVLSASFSDNTGACAAVVVDTDRLLLTTKEHIPSSANASKK